MLADRSAAHSIDHAQQKVLVVEVEVVGLFVTANGARFDPVSQAPEAMEGSVEVRHRLACLVAFLYVALIWRRRVALFQIHLAGLTKNRKDWIPEKENVSITPAVITWRQSSTAQTRLRGQCHSHLLSSLPDMDDKSFLLRSHTARVVPPCPSWA